MGLEAAIVRTLGTLPQRLQRALAGPPVQVDGDELAAEAQLFFRLGGLAGVQPYEELGVERARAQVDEETRVVAGGRLPVASVSELDADGLRARLYVPSGAGERGPLLVYFHGGGWVLGGIESHDATCRFLARETPVRVLAVDYRLAPEHRFPAAHDDALRAFGWASAEAGRLGADPGRLAVGGDSAGGNLAASVALAYARRPGGPAMQLLLYPVCDLSRKHASYERYARGYFLTDRTMDWYRSLYLPEESAALDPRASPLLADVGGVAPAYVAVAGFDPLRDEGLAFGERLRAAGVETDVRLHRNLVHGFANAPGVGRASPAAMREAAAALRARLV